MHNKNRMETVKEMQAAIDCDPHQSVMQPEALQHFLDEEI
jgi:hypothetical protein